MRIPNTGARRAVADATALLIYICVVYAAALWLYPLGRDYAALANPASLPPIADRLFAWEIATFGTSPPGYHLVNLALLYGCMLCLYRFVRLTIPGPFWLGTLSATLFMANPVHSEAMLNLSGAGDLFPALLALLALAAYAEHAVRPRAWVYALAVVYFAAAVLPYRQNAFLIAVPVLYEWLRLDETRRPVRLLPFGAIAAASWWLHADLFAIASLDPAGMFAPLYLIFYPIGLLPETAGLLHRHPALGWLAALTVVAVVALIYHKARRPVILFGLLSMAGVRLFQGGGFIDPVHMSGGGGLLLPNALFNVALVALFYRMTDHPKWHRPIVMMTTALAVFFFVLQIAMIIRWHEAARVVRKFQAAAVESGTMVGILPDYRYYCGAPVQLSEAIEHDTPFSKAVDHVSLLPIHYLPPRRLDVQVTEWSAAGIACTVKTPLPVRIAPYPFDLTEPGAVLSTDEARIEVRTVEEGEMRIGIRPAVQPGVLLPVKARLGSPLAPPMAPPMAQYGTQLAAMAPYIAGVLLKGTEMQTATTESLTPEQRGRLAESGWHERVGKERAVWVSISDQMVRVIENDTPIWHARCSTAVKGAGFKVDSNQTPLGWHSVAKKYGRTAKWGQVFRDKRRTNQIWKPGDAPDEDLVLTRLLALAGEEPGVNQGGDVDSFARCIYIHGTNAEDKIGTPASHGCIRLTNDDVIAAYDLIPKGALVLITE